MRPVTGLLFGVILLMTACGSTPGPDAIAGDLNERLQRRLAPDIEAGRVVLQPLPDGARVTYAEVALFPSGATALDLKGRYVVAGAIQGMVNPHLLQVDVAGTREAQAQSVADFFTEFLIGAYPQTHIQATAQPDAAGVAITMRAIAP